MNEKMNIDNRLESALRDDASQVAQLSQHVPDSLRARIARTPSVAATSSVGTAAVSATKFFTTKLMLASIGALAALIAVYFAVTPVDPSSPVIEQQPTNPPSAVIEIDTPVKRDSMSVRMIQPQSPQPRVDKRQSGPSQSDVDNLLQNMPEPKTTVTQSDSINARVKRPR